MPKSSWFKNAGAQTGRLDDDRPIEGRDLISKVRVGPATYQFPSFNSTE